MKKIKLFLVITLLFTCVTFFLSSFKEYNTYAPPACENLKYGEATVAILFNASTVNLYRNSNYDYFIPNPDIRSGDVPGQNMFDPTKFYCTIRITSPQCPNFLFLKTLETFGNTVQVKLPPAGYNASIEVNYYERGEDTSTPDFNKAVSDIAWGAPVGSLLPHSRVVYKYQKTIWSPNTGAIDPLYLNPSYNQGYKLDATGMIPAGGTGKSSIGDISGIGAYIDMNFTQIP